jgi:hypothetical protein
MLPDIITVSPMEITREARLRTLVRKKELGRAASYRELSRRIGKSPSTIQAVLTDGPRLGETNRLRVLNDVNWALDEIAREAAVEAPVRDLHPNLTPAA